jgi:hypothetical protein
MNQLIEPTSTASLLMPRLEKFLWTITDVTVSLLVLLYAAAFLHFI